MEIDFEVNYGLIAVHEGTIVHFVGYANEPTQEDINALREELRTDEEFELTEIADLLEILPAPNEVVQDFRSIIKDAPSSDS